MTEVVRRPTRVGSAVAVAAAGVSLAALAPTGSVGIGPGALGLALVAVGVVRGARTVLTAGAGFLCLGALLGATTDAIAAFPLVAAALAVVAWDVGENATSLGEQVGRAARTTHAELAHAAVSVAVGLGTAVVAFLIYLVAGGGRPLPALVLMLVGAVVLTWVLRR